MQAEYSDFTAVFKSLVSQVSPKFYFWRSRKLQWGIFFRKVEATLRQNTAINSFCASI